MKALPALLAAAALSLPIGAQKITSEKVIVNDEVWLPSYTEIHIGARILLFRGRGNVVQRFADHKKFNAESKIVAIEQ